MKYSAILLFATAASAAVIANNADPFKDVPGCARKCVEDKSVCDSTKIKDVKLLTNCLCDPKNQEKITKCIAKVKCSSQDFTKLIAMKTKCPAKASKTRVVKELFRQLVEPLQLENVEKRQSDEELVGVFPIEDVADFAEGEDATIRARSPQEEFEGEADDVEAAVLPDFEQPQFAKRQEENIDADMDEAIAADIEGPQLKKRQYPWGNGAYYPGDTQSVQINRLPGATPVVDDTSVFLNGGPGYLGYGGFGSFGGFNGYSGYGAYGGIYH